MNPGVLPLATDPKLYLLDDRKTVRVHPGEIIFGTNVLTDDHRVFAKIVKNALFDAGVDFYFVSEILAWAVGPDYQAVPLDKWAGRIRVRSQRPLAPLGRYRVYDVFRSLAAYWKAHHKIIVQMSNGHADRPSGR